ncbi:MAG: adenylate/guanylate cyclase domain-containing protein, partial [Rhodobacterales bacterium]|nr:adenylate/guanylate cyclase domain-containing protein [Rhodobacterales bacterium]
MQNNLSRFLFGERLPWLPPERVRQTFAEQESQSEILVGWVQLVLVGFFIAIYSLSPKTSAGTAFQPVPWVLGVYLFVTLLRLWLSYRTVLPGWLLMASIVIDMALLMGLIWSFHIQYEQPPSFYLKAPTVLYVFIFIAVRALRFSPRYVIVSGIVAALGWLALAGYVMVAEPGDPMITRDYVEYMTSNHILVGAEVDKIMSILVVTGVLAVALVRARRTMIQAVTETAAARELSRFVPTEIAARITRSDTRIAPGDGEVKEATILFTDIEGFSSVSEHLAPDALARMLNDYFAAISAILGRTGGVINQFQGDALLITFNTVRPDPD